MINNSYDIAIVGGNYAGLSAALFLGNACYKVILIDDGNPRNTISTRMQNVLGNELADSATFLTKARSEIAKFSNITVIYQTLTSIVNESLTLFKLYLKNDAMIIAKKIILATGVIDKLPNIPGINDFWATNIFHCPYCFAPDLINQPLSVYSHTEEAYFLALIIKKWTNDLIIFTDTHRVLSATQLEHLQSLGIKVNYDRLLYLSGIPGKHVDIYLDTGKVIKRRGIFMHLEFYQRADALIRELGLSINKFNPLIKVDEFFRTSVNGIYAIGDCSMLVQKITTAIGSGTTVGFAVDHDLTNELKVAVEQV